MHAETKDVDGRGEQRGIDPLPKQGGSRVRLDQVPREPQARRDYL
jgi:hypothetical protein